MSPFVSVLLALQSASLASGIRLDGDGRAIANDVPFYLYDLPQWTEKCDAHRRYGAKYYPDLAIHEVLVDHPWRTRNGSEAELFVVPGLFGLSARGGCGNHHKNMQEVDDMLTSSPFFSERLISRHVVPNFGYWLTNRRSLGVLQHRLQGAIFARHLMQGSRSFTLPYGPIFSGRIATLPPKHRNHSVFLVGQADNRPAYRTRRTAIRVLPERFTDGVLIQTCHKGRCSRMGPANAPDSAPLPECLRGKVAGCRTEPSFDMYASLGQQATYSLVIHGDDACTSRLYDAIQFGHMVVIISRGNSYPKVGMPFPNDLPWKDMALFLSSEAFVQNPTGTIENAVSQMSNESRRSLWRQARPFLDWTMGHPCMGTAIISHVARKFLGKSVPPAFVSCHLQPKLVKTAAGTAQLGPEALEELKEALMEERLD